MKSNWIAIAVSAGLLVFGQCLLAQDRPAQPAQPGQTSPDYNKTRPDKTQPDINTTQPDNTRMNKNERNSADRATTTAGDRDVVQKIRKSIMDDKTLSTYAHNVKITAHDGKVTLKGPVHTEEEKSSIERMATDVAGAGNVTNEITVKPSKKTKTL